MCDKEFETYEYVYLVQPSEFKGTKVFKPGKTVSVHSRLGNYGPGTVVFLLYRVTDCEVVETEILERFSNQFTLEKGQEYYSGDLIQMIEVIDNIVSELDQKLDDDEPDSLLRRYYKNRITYCSDPEKFIINCEENLIKKEENTESDDDVQDGKNSDNDDGFDLLENKTKNKKKFLCDICEKSFSSKQRVDYHMKRQICVDKNIQCDHCFGRFLSNSAMYRHIRENCKVKKEELEVENMKKNKLQTENNKLKTKLKQIEERHMKLLKNTQMNNVSKTKMVKISKSVKKVQNIVDKINLSEFDGKINNKPSDDDMIDILRQGYNSIVKFIELIHFDPKTPENHNIYISNIKNRFVSVFNGRKWILRQRDEVITHLYREVRNYIEDNLDEYNEELTNSEKRVLNKLFILATDSKQAQFIKMQIELLLYNNRDIAIETKENIENNTN
jgi:hypothetical protein